MTCEELRLKITENNEARTLTEKIDRWLFDVTRPLRYWIDDYLEKLKNPPEINRYNLFSKHPETGEIQYCYRMYHTSLKKAAKYSKKGLRPARKGDDLEYYVVEHWFDHMWSMEDREQDWVRIK